MNFRFFAVGIFAIFLFASSVNCQEDGQEDETRSQRWSRRFNEAKGWLRERVYSPVMVQSSLVKA